MHLTAVSMARHCLPPAWLDRIRSLKLVNRGMSFLTSTGSFQISLRTASYDFTKKSSTTGLVRIWKSSFQDDVKSQVWSPNMHSFRSAMIGSFLDGLQDQEAINATRSDLWALMNWFG